MPDVTKKEVLAVVKDSGEAVSATAISKELGFSKKSNVVCDFLEELISDGCVSADNNGSFTKYSFLKSKAAVAPKEEKKSGPVNEALGAFDPSSVRIPVDLHGFDIEENSRGFKITTAQGNVHQITKTQRILVINEKKKLLVYQPEDVLFAIDDYCRKEQIQSYILKDLSVGRTIAPKDINMNPCIIFVQVEKHNKAGF